MVNFTDTGTDVQILGIVTNRVRQHILTLFFACTFQGGKKNPSFKTPSVHCVNPDMSGIRRNVSTAQLRRINAFGQKAPPE